jgi:hypothetical protein
LNKQTKKYEKEANKSPSMSCRGGVIFTTLTSSDNEINTQIARLEQRPPLVKQVKVQKLITPLENGNNMILRIKYYEDPTIPKKLNIYDDVNYILALKDDGIAPDIEANDFIYASYLKQDLNKFVNEIKEKENYVTSKGGFIKFDGHNGNFIDAKNITLFNLNTWNQNEEVELYTPILDVATCDNNLLKQNSLLITDLSVVEDPARTFNVYNGTGQANGVWTFGTMMKNIANTAKTGVSTKEFLKQWVKTWVEDQYIGNNIVLTREKAFLHLITPWMIKANVSNTVNLPILPTGADPGQIKLQPWIAMDPTGNYPMWEVWWDLLDENNLLKYAPFKLMAIVNRIDLRSNGAYQPGRKNSGETRFVYTLINPLNGLPPFHDNPLFASNSGAIDWQGMNVIFEFGNPFNHNCDLQNFAQQWFDLSSQPLGINGVANPIYNQMLEDITTQVTAIGAGGTKNYNGSAINQIRTNEKILEPLNIAGTAFNNPTWIPLTWQLRQFELNNADGYLHPALVTNTSKDNLPSGTLEHFIYGPNSNPCEKQHVASGNFNLPNSWLAGAANLEKEFVTFKPLNAGALPANIYNPATYNINTDNPNAMFKQVSHQISLNTCQGCHGGETKTDFTQIMPLGYGQAANYWDAIPSIQTNSLLPGTPTLDHNFIANENNNNTTYDVFTQSDEDNNDEVEITSNIYNQVVSPFLTGRRYSSVTSNNWQDDELWDASIEAPIGALQAQWPQTFWKSDEKLTGLYFVNDPSNFSITRTLPFGKGGDFPQIHTQRWGFNELERRKKDLCNFVSHTCIVEVVEVCPNILVKVVQSIKHVPLPIKGH